MHQLNIQIQNLPSSTTSNGK